jgi:hypothetical protein
MKSKGFSVVRGMTRYIKDIRVPLVGVAIVCIHTSNPCGTLQPMAEVSVANVCMLILYLRTVFAELEIGQQIQTQ